MLNSGVEQRLESHALVDEVRRWPHRCFAFSLPNRTAPVFGRADPPPPVPEASGEGQFWWYGDGLAIFAELHSWIWNELDHWNCWSFARRRDDMADLRALPTFAALTPVEYDWCYLCTQPVSSGQICLPEN